MSDSKNIEVTQKHTLSALSEKNNENETFESFVKSHKQFQIKSKVILDPNVMHSNTSISHTCFNPSLASHETNLLATDLKLKLMKKT